jgi:hypothetical protein
LGSYPPQVLCEFCCELLEQRLSSGNFKPGKLSKENNAILILLWSAEPGEAAIRVDNFAYPSGCGSAARSGFGAASQFPQ